MSDEFTVSGLTTDNIADFGGEVLPLGLYQMRATKCEPRAKDGEGEGEDRGAWVELTLTVSKDLRDGTTTAMDATGLTITKFFYTNISRWKDGRIGSRGLSQAKAYLAAVGVPLKLKLDEFYPKTTMKGARQVAKALVEGFRGKEVTVQVIPEAVQKKNEQTGKYEDVKDDTGHTKVRHIPVVLGIVKPSVQNIIDEPPVEDEEPGDAMSLL